MPVDVNIRKKANKYFFGKVIFNGVLVLIGAILILAFLTRMQHHTALLKQRKNNEQSLTDAISILQRNSVDADDLSTIFHDGNQDMLDDLKELFNSGLFNFLSDVDNKERSEVFADIVERSGVDYLFFMSRDGKVVISPVEELYGQNLVDLELISSSNLFRLSEGTRQRYNRVVPVKESNAYGDYYFYSLIYNYGGVPYVMVLGADASDLDMQINALSDVSVVLKRTAVGNDGFLFAVNKSDSTFLYYENKKEVLTGQNALDAGLSEAALKDGYSGVEIINGIKYYCTSKTFRSSTVICAVADTDNIYSDDKYVIFWAETSFIMVMILCLVYAVIVRNDFVRQQVVTEKKYFITKKGKKIIFDISIFKKVFPLMMTGILVIFGMSYYNQTLLEISESVDDSVVALDEVSNRYQESLVNRESIKQYYDNRFLAKAKLIAYLIEEDPAVLNEESDRLYSYYDEQGIKHYITDDEGNELKSVSSNARLQELCENNDLESVYIFDEDGHTIATSTPNWYFTVSHDPKDQSYDFLQILDGKKDVLVQDAMMSDVGEHSQYIGVAFKYYTMLGDNGETVYISKYAYESLKNSGSSKATAHRAMLQIGLRGDLTDKILSSTDVDYIFSTDALSGGFIVLFDNTEDHVCLYSPYEARIGMKAKDIGLPAIAFTGADYYGFNHVNGITYFQYFRYNDGYFIATAIPKSEMFSARTPVSIVTAVTSLVLILVLLGTVTFTTEEEEMLYATMSESQEEKGFESTIFNVILPSGHSAATMDAAARWDNRYIKWSEKAPEQKLIMMLSFICGIIAVYIMIAVLGVNTFFKEGSVIKYIIGGNWDRGLNIFALSACMMVIVFISFAEVLLKIPVKLITSMLGARGETVGHLFLSIIKYGGAIGVLFYCLYLFGVDSTSLLASAGVLSLVIGLGAQSLIKDIIAGIFIVFEGEFRVGDIVTIDGYRGTVMDIGLRTTKIRGGDLNIKIYNNSDITGVLNMTKEASLSFITISIEYGQDIRYVEAVLNRELPHFREKNPKLLEDPKFMGVTKLGDSGVEIMVMCKSTENDIKGVQRFMNRELLQTFYDNGINVPFTNVTISNLDESQRKTMMDFMPEESAGSDEFETIEFDDMRSR